VDVLAQFNPRGKRWWIIMAGIILVADCAERALYLYGQQPGKTAEDFERDFAQCEVQARLVPFEQSALTFGSLRDNCMRAQGWRRANRH
jgi:hypothetical protein